MSRAGEAKDSHAGKGTLLNARLPLLIELNDLKRVRVAGERYSLAANIFRRSWAALVEGENPTDVAERATAHALAAARLGGISRRVLRDGGLTEKSIQSLLKRSFDEVTLQFDEATRARYRARLAEDLRQELIDNSQNEKSSLPAFVELLAQQPRAGATRPGHARVVLEPAENHAEHCATVAVYAALLADVYETESTLPFLAGLAHHLQNAYLPDAGYAADEIIGEHLPKIFDTFRRRALDELPATLAATIEEALTHTRDASTSEARAFQAADVLDRVLEMRWHAQSAAFTLDVALEEMDIVHPGVTQEFHLSVMRDAGLS